MRKIALLLLLSLLFLTGCRQQDATDPVDSAPDSLPAPIYETGQFYADGGYLQNTLMYIAMDQQALQAPVTSLAYYIVNDTDYTAYVRDVFIEVYRDGEWVEWEIDVYDHLESNRSWLFKAKTNSPWKVTLTDDGEGSGDEKHYKPLQAGEYRITHTYGLNIPQEQQPEGQPYLIAYFTVTERAA